MPDAASPRRPLFLVPARGGSKRVPRKNIALLGDRPLLAWSLAPALDSGLADAVYVSSEDDEILAEARRWGGTPVPRTARLARDDTTLAELCREILPELAAHTGATDLYLLTPTAPFRTAATIRQAWESHLAWGGSSLVSVEPFAYPPQWALTESQGRLEPLFPDLYAVSRPKLPVALKHDGGHIITGIARFLAEHDFFGADARPFRTPDAERLDIDQTEDLQRARAILATADGGLAR